MFNILFRDGKLKNDNYNLNEINKKLIPLNMAAIYFEADNMIYLLNRNPYENKFHDIIRNKKFDNLLLKYITSPESIIDKERDELHKNNIIKAEGNFTIQFLEQNRYGLIDEYP